LHINIVAGIKLLVRPAKNRQYVSIDWATAGLQNIGWKISQFCIHHARLFKSMGSKLFAARF